MAQERWRFNDVSYASNTTLTRDGTSYHILTNVTNGDLSTTTSSWEGSRALIAKTSGNGARFRLANNTGDLGALYPPTKTYYADFLWYINSSETNGNFWNLFLTGNDASLHYSWLNCSKNSSGNYEFKIQSWDQVSAVVTTHATLSTTQACGSWVRLNIKINPICVERIRFWNAAAVATMDSNGTNENATYTNSTEMYPVTTFGWGVEWTNLVFCSGDASATTARVDDLLFGDTESLTRGSGSGGTSYAGIIPI